jgi:glycosyltransferase involved in cell wall biosynthesis
VRVLFVHQNFPGQYAHLAAHLAAQPGNEVVFITQRPNHPIPGVKRIVYKAARKLSAETHHFVRSLEAAVLNAEAVYGVAMQLKKSGFVPDIMLGHNGWGETLYLKDAFPDTPLLSYFEFFYHSHGADIGFDPEFPASTNIKLRAHTLNAVNLIGLQVADLGQTPTQWQKAQYPAEYHDKLRVIHEGIDTDVVKPDPEAFIILKKAGVRLTAKDEVITYVARNLEPYRGFHIFMRAVPEIQKRRPKAHIIIVGGDEVSYGSSLPHGQTFRKRMLAEVGKDIDPKRLHFLGRVPYAAYLKVLQVSSAHVYLTYPFVLSWSMLEAMAAGCLVIGSRTAPVEEVICDRKNGLLVDFFSDREISECLDEVLEHPNRWRPMREQARAVVLQRYDLDRLCLPGQISQVRRLIGRSSDARRHGTNEQEVAV